MSDIEIKHNWISVSELMPPEGKRVETKIESPNMGNWCLIKRIYSNGCWNVVDDCYREFDQTKFNPTHWHL